MALHRRPQSEREIEEFVAEMLGSERSAAFRHTWRDTYISQDVIDAAFASLLENIQFARERRNLGYLHALLPATTLQP